MSAECDEVGLRLVHGFVKLEFGSVLESGSKASAFNC